MSVALFTFQMKTGDYFKICFRFMYNWYYSGMIDTLTR